MNGNTQLNHKIKIGTVLLLDQHPLICQGLESIVCDIFDDVAVRWINNLDQVEDIKSYMMPELLVFVDLFSLGSCSLDELVNFRVGNRDVKIVICSDTDDTCLINWCLSLGVTGFISKRASVGDVKLSIEYLLSDNALLPLSEHAWTPRHFKPSQAREIVIEPCKFPLNNLTSKELATLKYLTSGMSNRNIAEKLGVAESTTKSHVASILHKMEVLNRTEAVSEYHRACRLLDDSSENFLAHSMG